jgi:hypothetical protein
MGNLRHECPSHSEVGCLVDSNNIKCNIKYIKGAPINEFGSIPIKAAEIYKKQMIKDPRKARDEAAAWKDNQCSRRVFLSLCAGGLVKFISNGNYADRIWQNREHTL